MHRSHKAPRFFAGSAGFRARQFSPAPRKPGRWAPNPVAPRQIPPEPRKNISNIHENKGKCAKSCSAAPNPTRATFAPNPPSAAPNLPSATLRAPNRAALLRPQTLGTKCLRPQEPARTTPARARKIFPPPKGLPFEICRLNEGTSAKQVIEETKTT